MHIGKGITGTNMKYTKNKLKITNIFKFIFIRQIFKLLRSREKSARKFPTPGFSNDQDFATFALSTLYFAEIF